MIQSKISYYFILVIHACVAFQLLERTCHPCCWSWVKGLLSVFIIWEFRMELLFRSWNSGNEPDLFLYIWGIFFSKKFNNSSPFFIYITVYICLFCGTRQTANELTGEHSCIMLKLLNNDTVQALDSSWLKEYWKDFRRRFVSLLSFQFRVFAPALAMSLLQNKNQALDPPVGMFHVLDIYLQII